MATMGDAPAAVASSEPPPTTDGLMHNHIVVDIHAPLSGVSHANATAVVDAAPPQSTAVSSTRSPDSTLSSSSSTSTATVATTTLSSSTSLAAHTQPLPPPSSHALPIVRGKLGRPSSKFGTVNYSVDEMKRLIDKVRAVVPVAADDWLHVAYQFNYMRPESIPYREVESLKRKFKKMYCSRASAGGVLPEYVKDAKELRQLINQRSERSQIQLDHGANSDSQSEIGGDDDSTRTTPRSSSASALAGGGDLTSATDGTMTDELGENGDATRDIAARLQRMEDEYNASKRSASTTTTSEPSLDTPVNSTTTSNPATIRPSPLYDPMLASGDAGVASLTTTSGIINLLKHSVERKRRTTEELLLSESERVRKERKKRKMERVLYNIHVGGGGASAVSDVETTESTLPPMSPGGLNASSSTASLLSSPYASAMATSGSELNMMELVLQFMVAQQHETARREREEDERRRKEAEEKARRRKAKDAQRQQETHEMMVVFEALLQSGFPEELRHHLVPPSLRSSTSSYETGNGTTETSTASVGVPAASQGTDVTSAVATDGDGEDHTLL